MNMDYLAYLILALFVIFAVLPLLVSNNGESYRECLKVSFALTAFILAFAVVLFSLVWAVNRVI